MNQHELRMRWLALLILLLLAPGIAKAQDLVRTAATMDNPRAVELLEGELKAVAEGENKTTVLRADGPFTSRIDLKPRDIDPRKHDLLKLQIKADARAMVQVSLENYPEPGQLSHWYLFSKSRGAFDWETVWVDLHRPEEIMAAGAYKGLEKDDLSLRGLRLSGFIGESKRASQPAGRRIWLGPIRFLKKAVDLDWDQRRAPYTWEKGQDLTFRYPLAVANRLDRELTVRLELVPLKVEHARATLSQQRVTLRPGETKTVEASLILPAAVAAKKPPLYAERFLARAEAEGIADSAVTILRSSDPIDLTVTVPIPEDKLHFPLLPRRKDLSEAISGFGRQRPQAERLADQVRPEDLGTAVGDGVGNGRGVGKDNGLYPWKANEAADRYLDGLTATAFLYDLTGEKKYLDRGTALLLAAADKFPPLLQQWQRRDVAEISHGVIAMNTLRLGWATGSMRPPYYFQRHGMFNDFDLLAAGMADRDRKRILEEFVVPAAIQMRNHGFGLGNQQDVVNYAILYAGLATRNWPLASFAYDSDYGLRNQIAWDFDDDGLAGEGHYHTPAIRPILYATELLHRAGLDLYDERLHQITHSLAAEAIGKPFRDSIRDYIDANRFAGKGIQATSKTTDGFHLQSGVTLLRWNGLEVSMNWGTHIHRGAPDRMTLGINAPERSPLRRIGGGNYSHSSLGQSILIVDESRQNPVRAQVTGHDIEGPVQFVQAVSAEHFPGTTITRTFALLGQHVLVLDRAKSDRPRTFDWCLRYPGEAQTYKDVAASVSLELEPRKGSFTNKPGESALGVNFGASLRSDGYLTATTGGEWRQSNGRLVMAGTPGTQVLVFAVPAAFSATQKERVNGVPILMARRAGVRQTDYVAAFSPRVKQVVQIPVTRGDGAPADAIGVEVKQEDGKTFLAVANFEPEGVEVRVGSLKTKDRFATTYQGD